ncbi:hypothetical protein CTAYLR_001412 [Chrysophaeum taylorii]|uniref:Transmembrane protein n=1 Tax=Chrysophaeum taylorii TaxID=2483200 RepID=A0AAD7U8W4_9STRA|nr:hypothetical protein CTAYLR_001412 [Chrysophaeum taylorii]
MERAFEPSDRVDMRRRREQESDARTVMLSLGMCAALFVCFVVIATKVGATHLKDDDADFLFGREICEKHIVLVTGFETFLQNTTFENPSKTAAIALNASCGRHYCVEAMVLPVESSATRLPATMLSRVSAVLHLGLEDSAKGLKLEIAAKNIKGDARNAARGADVQCGDAAPAVSNAPCLTATTAPLDRMLLRNVLENTTELWSRDPGAFLCNEVYFHTLDTIRRAHLTVPRLLCTHNHVLVMPALIPALFVHLPSPENTPFHAYEPILREILDALGEPPILGVRLPIDELGRRRSR